MSHTLTIAGLDDFEAEHIAGILNDYKTALIEKKIDALVKKDEGTMQWIEDHLAWHETIMKKAVWAKENG